MKHFFLTIICISALCVTPAFSGPSALKIIRSWYQKVHKDIKNEFVIQTVVDHNRNRSPIPGIGLKTQVINFYHYNPDLLEQTGESGTVPVGVVFISVDSQAAGFKEHREYLFNRKGKLAFYYLSIESITDERYYFTGRKPVYVRRGKKGSSRLTPREVKQARTAIAESVALQRAFLGLPHIDFQSNRKRFYESMDK